MTILVIGGAGYIGSHMCLELKDAGETFIVLDDLSTGFRSAVPSGVPLVVGDFGDRALVSRLINQHNITAIIHFAAKIVVPESIADPLSYYKNNTAKALSLIECAVEGGVKHFIFSSTAAVYGEPQRNPVSEDDPCSPMSPYGRSKLMVEWMLADASRAYDLKHVVLRYFNVAGADPKGRSGQSTANATHLIKVAVQAALGYRKRMEIFGTDYPTPDGSCLRDYIQVSDLAQAHLDALRYLRNGGQSITCNCGYQHGYSVKEVIKVVKQISGNDFPVIYLDRRPGDPTEIIADKSKIREALGWQPNFNDLKSIVQQALNWERELHNEKKGKKIT